jgi:hypothetical protein
MLRNHFGWARRLSSAVMLLVPVVCSNARGGPIIDGSALVPVTLTSSPSAPYHPPTTYSLSGFVYVDAADDGVKLPGEWGLQNVTLTISEYAPNGAIAFTATTATNAAGHYLFTGLQPGDTCTIGETQPGNYYLTTATVGDFVSASGGSMAMNPAASPAAAAISALSNSNVNILSVVLPSATGAYAPNGSGVYTGVNFNFGELPITAIGNSDGTRLPLSPGVPASAAATAPNGSLSTALALVGGNNRFLAGPSAGVIGLTATIANPSAAGFSSVNWQVSSLSTGLSVSSNSGTALAPQTATTLTGSLDGTNLTAGAQNVVFTVSGQVPSSGVSVPGSTASVLVDPVYSRGIDSVSTASFGRIMQGGVVGSSFTVSSTGAYSQYSNLTMNPATLSGADPSGSYTVTNTGSVLFNGTNTVSSAVAISATIANSITGPVTGNVVLPGNTGLFTGETLAAGTPTLPSLSVPYTATVLEPRSLQAVAGGSAASAITVPTTGGGLLYGTVVSVPDAYLVTSTNVNPDSDHASMVNVSGQTASAVSTADGVTAVGTVTAGQTLFNSGGTQAIDIAIQANSYGPTSGSTSLSVVSAEAASVQDNTHYASLPLVYNISNVGYAAVGGVDPSNASSQLLGAPLSGTFVGGSHLGSRVAATGNQGQNSVTSVYDGSTLSQQSAVTASNVTGTVGSQCDIFADPSMSGSYNVTMSWRARNADENGSAFVNGNPASTNWPTVLPAGVPALTSDVVEIGGLPSGVAYALQISYDDRINTFLNGSTGSATVQDSYVVKQVTNSSGDVMWENAVLDNTTSGSQAQTAVAMPLNNVYDSSGNLVEEGFLNMEYAQGYTLSQLVGSWGVDLADQQAWAIVNSGGGDFAVVPEPSTFVLLGAAAAGLLVYRLRRRIALI